jgi:hypothetical protein
MKNNQNDIDGINAMYLLYGMPDKRNQANFKRQQKKAGAASSRGLKPLKRKFVQDKTSSPTQGKTEFS